MGDGNQYILYEEIEIYWICTYTADLSMLGIKPTGKLAKEKSTCYGASTN